MAALNESSVQRKFANVNNTQDSIQSLSLWVLHHKAHSERIVELWYKAVKKGESCLGRGFRTRCVFRGVLTETDFYKPIWKVWLNSIHDTSILRLFTVLVISVSVMNTSKFQTLRLLAACVFSEDSTPFDTVLHLQRNRSNVQEETCNHVQGRIQGSSQRCGAFGQVRTTCCTGPETDGFSRNRCANCRKQTSINDDKLAFQRPIHSPECRQNTENLDRAKGVRCWIYGGSAFFVGYVPLHFTKLLNSKCHHFVEKLSGNQKIWSCSQSKLFARCCPLLDILCGTNLIENCTTLLSGFQTMWKPVQHSIQNYSQNSRWSSERICWNGTTSKIFVWSSLMANFRCSRSRQLWWKNFGALENLNSIRRQKGGSWAPFVWMHPV